MNLVSGVTVDAYKQKRPQVIYAFYQALGGSSRETTLYTTELKTQITEEE